MKVSTVNLWADARKEEVWLAVLLVRLGVKLPGCWDSVSISGREKLFQTNMVPWLKAARLTRTQLNNFLLSTLLQKFNYAERTTATFNQTKNTSYKLSI